MTNDERMTIILETLRKTYTGDTNEIKLAENVLKNYEEYVISNAKPLIEFLSQKEIDFNLRQSLASYIKRTIIQKEKTFSIEKPKVLDIISSLFSFLTKNKIPLEHQILSQLTSLFLSLLSSTIISGDASLYTQLNTSLIESSNDTNKIIIYSLLHVLISSPGVTLEKFNEISQKQLEFMQKDLYSKQSSVELLRAVLDLSFLTMKKMKKLNMLNNLIENYINLQTKGICETISRFCYKKNNIVTFINKGAIQEEIHKVMMVNSLIEKCLLVLSFFIQSSCKGKINNKELSLYVNQLLPFIHQSLIKIASHYIEYSQQEKEDGNYELLIYRSLFFISRCIVCQPFTNQFQDNYLSFVFNILFPFLSTCEENRTLLISSPEEYHSCILDSMVDFKIKIPSTASGYLLGIICDEFEESGIKILTFSSQLLNFCMNEIDERAIGSYPQINNELGKNLIRNYSPEIDIDTCLLFMCILAKHTIQNEEIKKILRNFLLANQQRLEDISSDIIQYKICLIYGLFLDDLFDPDEHSLFIEKAMYFLLKLILKKKEKNDGLAYQALHSFAQIVEVRNFKDIANNIVREKARELIDMIPIVEIDIFFDMVDTLINNLNLEDYAIQFLEKTVMRFKDNAEKDKVKGKCNVFIPKELEVIKSIIQTTQYNSQIENIIQPVIELITKIKDIEYAENIFDILLATTAQNNIVNPLLFKIFPYYIDYVKSQKGLEKRLFQILNFILLKDNNNLINTQSDLLNNFNMIISTSFQMIDEYLEDPSPIYTLLLIIIWFSNRKNPITQVNLIGDLLSHLLDKMDDIFLVYRENLNDISTTKDLYLLWGYLGVIYSSFMNYANVSLNIIINKNYLNKLLQLTTLLYKSSFYSSSIGKIVIMGICNVLSDQNALKVIFSVLEKQIIILINLMNKQYTIKDDDGSNEENEESSKDIDEEDSEEEFYDKKENIEDNNMKELISQAIFPNEDIDEYEVFSKVISILQSFNETKEIMAKILNNLNESEKKQFINLIHTRKVNINKKSGIKQIPRRIVKIKKK